MSTVEKLLGGIQLGISNPDDFISETNKFIRLCDIVDVSKDIISRKQFEPTTMIFDMDTNKVLRWIIVKRSVGNRLSIYARDAYHGENVTLMNVTKDDIKRRIIGLKKHFQLKNK